MTTCNEINKISIKDYLKSIGLHPVKDRGYYGMYRSPFREDISASLKVDYHKNLWIDFGTNEGGTIIDLVMKLHDYSVGEAISLLESFNKGKQSTSFSFHGNHSGINKSKENEAPVFQIKEMKELTNPILQDYLKKRSINIEIAKLYCKEIHYSVHGKPYFAIGFPNDSGGWVLRSPTFKGCTSMDVKTYHTSSNKDACLLFEGFMDFLSYLTLKREQKPNQDAVILNSVTNFPKTIKQLSDYPVINAFLDNDESGKRVVLELQSYSKQVNDQSIYYNNCNDLNDYLCERSKPKVFIPKKRKKGLGL